MTTNLRLVGVACLASGLAVGLAIGMAEPRGFACQEDEVAAVIIDTNPDHGLAWECVNAEEHTQQEAGR